MRKNLSHNITIPHTHYTCTGRDTAHLLIQSPIHVIIAPSEMICQGSSVTICPTTSGNYKYLWSTGDTTRCITVSPAVTTTYKLTVSAATGACGGASNIVTIYVCPADTVTLTPLITCICPGSPPVPMSTLFTPNIISGGYYINSGPVQNGTFNPRRANTGWNRVTYCVTKICSTGGGYHSRCTYCATDSVFVDTTEAHLKPLGTICITNPAVILNGIPAGPGGSYSISGIGPGYLSGNIFYPNGGGGFYYTITYTYTDACGCTTSESQYVKVVSQPNFILYADTAGVCEGDPVIISPIFTVYGETADDYTFSWSDGSTGYTDTVYTNGTDLLTMNTYDGYCPYVQVFNLNLRNCCSTTPDITGNHIIYGPGTFTWNPSTIGNKHLVIDGTIFVTNGATLIVDNMDLFMQNCSDFIVDRCATLVLQNNTHIGFCQWHGIEVWGSIDNCAEDASCPSGQGTLNMTNTIIDDADVAVFAGTRGLNINYTANYPFIPTKYLGGGILNISYSTFNNNYLDIMYSERNVGGLCHVYTCPLSNLGWYGYVWYNTFKPLGSSLCSDESFTLDTMTAAYGGIGGGCNILDMDLSPWVWSYPWSLGSFQTFCGSLWIPMFLVNKTINCAVDVSQNVPSYFGPPGSPVFYNNTWTYPYPCSPLLYH